MITSKSINVLKCCKIQIHVHVLPLSCIEHMKTTLSKQRQVKGSNNIPSFLQWTAPIAHAFCEGCTWHHLHILVKAPLCCDWKGRTTSAQSFPLLHQATTTIPRRDHFISTCSRHMGVVHHAHPVRGESHIHHNASCNTCTKVGLGFWNDWEWKRQVKCNLNKLRYK